MRFPSGIPFGWVGRALGVASLDAGGQVPLAQLPAGFGSPTVVASEAAMLALPDAPGQRALRTDLTPDQIFVQTQSPATVLANWQLTTADVASEVAFTPNGDITETNTQSAVEGVRTRAATALTTHAGVAATEGVAAHAEIATQGEVNTGTDDTRIVTPLKFATRLAAVVDALTFPLAGIWQALTAPVPSFFTLVNGKYWEYPKAGAAKGKLTGATMIPANFDTTENPQVTVNFIVSGAGAGPANVRLELTAKYVPPFGDASGAVDQTILVTHPVVNTLNEEHQVNFTLNAAQIDALSPATFSIRRLNGDGADTFTGDIAFRENWILPIGETV